MIKHSFEYDTNQTSLENVDCGALFEMLELEIKAHKIQGGGVLITFGYDGTVKVRLIEPDLEKMGAGERIGFDMGTFNFTIGKK